MEQGDLYFYEDRTPFSERLIWIVVAAVVAVLELKDFIKNFVNELKLGYYTEHGIKKMGRIGLRKILPHRGNALMIDGISYDPKKPDEIIATKRLRRWDPLFDGHFPDNPIFSGHFLEECMCLASAALAKLANENFKGLPVVAKKEGVSFENPARPGDLLKIHSQLIREKLGVFIFSAEILNQENRIVAKIEKLTGVSSVKKD